MAKIVVKSEFYTNTGYNFEVNDKYLSDAGADYASDYLHVDEIPEFIAWLQAEYDKQKAGN